MAGPPFAISTQQLQDYYSSEYDIQLLDRQTELLKGKVNARKNLAAKEIASSQNKNVHGTFKYFTLIPWRATIIAASKPVIRLVYGT